MRARSLIAGTAAIILGCGLAPTASAEPPSQPTMTSSTPTAQVGSHVTFSHNDVCSGAAADGTNQIAISLDGRTVATGTVAADGTWMTSVEVPGEPGTYTYQATCTTPL